MARTLDEIDAALATVEATVADLATRVNTLETAAQQARNAIVNIRAADQKLGDDLAIVAGLVKKLGKRVGALQGAGGVNTVRRERVMVRGKVVTRLVAGPSPAEAKPRGSTASKIIRSGDR